MRLTNSIAATLTVLILIILALGCSDNVYKEKAMADSGMKIAVDNTIFSKKINNLAKNTKINVIKQNEEARKTVEKKSTEYEGGIISTKTTKRTFTSWVHIAQNEWPDLGTIIQKYGQADTVEVHTGPRGKNYSVYFYGGTGFAVEKDVADGKVEHIIITG